MISQGNFHTEAKHMYIYNLRARSYRGFFDLTAITYSQTKHVTLDFYFLEENNRGALALFVENDVYLIGESEGRIWRIERKIPSCFNYSSPKSLSVNMIINQYKNCLVGVVNNRHVFFINDAEILAKNEPE